MAALIGRTSELAALEAALDGIREGPGRVVDLRGEPGIGKTRLLAELGELAEERKYLVLSGRGAELERDLPFGPFVDALDDYLGSLSPSLFERLGEDTAAELAAISPSIPVSAGPPASGPQAERFRAHRAVRLLLEALSGPRPLVLCIDDLQWGDPASVELVLHLLRKRPAGSVLLVLALRPRQAPGRLLAALDGARREGSAELLGLGPLDRGRADALLGDAVDRMTREALYRDSGGNPFYLEQLARTVGARGAQPRTLDSLAGEELPDAVIAALAVELDELSAGARRVLGWAAVLGEPFESDVAAEPAGMPEDDALTALDELLDSGL